MQFEDLKITRQFLNAIEDLGFDQATEIQTKAIPVIRGGQDIVGIAQTGTGKTAAYLLPILQTLKYAQGDHPRALIFAPTKELVLQVKQMADALSKYTDIRTLGLYGGVGPKAQQEALAKGVDLIVATPGRFLDLYLNNHIHLRGIKQMVLDEADRMMDMGFMPQLRRILEVMPRKRQNLLFSATFPEKVEVLSEEFLDFPERIEASPESTAVETVSQVLYEVPNVATKRNLLHHLLRDEALSRVIVFVRSKSEAENLGKFLKRTEVGEVRAIHSNRAQNSRINAMDDFKAGEVRVLVSTDVSARGIDVLEVSHVINFDVPREYHDYVHRIGRTGRAFRTGTAISFANHAEQYHVKQIEDLIQQKIPRAKMPEAVEILSTPKLEMIEMAREIDYQKRKADPNFKGAFHDKKTRDDKRKFKAEKRSKKRPKKK